MHNKLDRMAPLITKEKKRGREKEPTLYFTLCIHNKLDRMAPLIFHL